MDLLTRLNQWAYRQDENFMTEAFVYLLQYLQKHEPKVAARLLSQITNNHLKVKTEECNDITISTQVSTDQGRPDIEIKTSKSLVYIEVKSESGLGVMQMKRYRTALEKSGYDDTYLCLLTKYSIVKGSDGDHPDFFLRWSNIYEFLSNIVVTNDVSRYVLNQFMQFLESKGIVMEHVSWQLVEGVKSLHNLLNMLGKAIESNKIASKPLSGGKEYIGYYTDEKRNWIGIYYSQPALLIFEVTSNKPLDANSLKTLGLTEADLDMPNRISIKFDLSNEENHFFARDRTSQLKFLETQVAEWRKLEQKARQLGL